MALPPSLEESLKTISINFSFLPSIATNLGVAARSVGRLVEMEGGDKADASKFFAAEDLKESEAEAKPEETTPTPVKEKKKGKPLKDQFSLANIMTGLAGIIALGPLIMDIVAPLWDSIVESVKEWVGGLWESIKTKFDEFITYIKDWFNETIQPLVDKVLGFVDEWIIEPIKTFFGKIADFFVGYFKFWYNLITSPVETIKKVWDGVKGAIDSVIQKIADTYVNLSFPLKKAADFLLPKKVQDELSARGKKEGAKEETKEKPKEETKEKPKEVEPPAPPDEGRAKAAAASRKARLKKKAAPAPTPSAAPQPVKIPPKTEPSAAAPAATAEKAPSKQEMKPVKIDSNTGKKAVLAEMDSRGITDKTQRASIMAQIGHESGGFQYLSENLNYSEKGLNAIFGKYFKRAGRDAKEYARNPYKIANVVYGGRMGNTAPDDGWRYRGRGFLQLTGKNNYNKFGFGGSPDQVSEPKNAAKTALDYMMGYKGDWADIKKITKFVNGGYIGLDDRKKHFEEYLADASITEVKSGPSLASGGVSGASTSVASGQRQQAKPQTPVIVNAPSSTTNVVKQNVNRVAQTQKDAGKALTARIA